MYKRQQPNILTANLTELPQVLTNCNQNIRFDCIMGRNILMSETDKQKIVRELIPWLSDSGVMIFGETVPQHTQRVYKLLETTWLSTKLLSKLKQAEEAIYQDDTNPMVNWDSITLQRDLETISQSVQIDLEHFNTSMLITPKLIEHWFSLTNKTQKRISYRSHLEKILSAAEIDRIKTAFEKYLCHRTVSWSHTVAYITLK